MQHHAGGLRALGTDPNWLDRFLHDPTAAELEPRDQALLSFAERLTRAPSTLREEDVRALRDAGFDDRAILDAVEVIAYYNFVNRLADGLGVGLEDAPRKEGP